MSNARMDMSLGGGFAGSFETVETVDLAQFKPRSFGVMDAREMEFCKQAGIPMAYDPAQIGWVMADCADDLTTALKGRASMAAGLRLRAWTNADAPRLAALLSDPEVWKHLPEGFSGALSEDVAKALIHLSHDTARHLVMAIERGTEIVGQVRLEFGISSDTSVAEISYWIGSAHWGKGLGREIVSRFTAQCFAQRPDIQTIEAKVHQDNTASAKALLRAGYDMTGAHPFGLDWQRYAITR